MSQGMTHEEWYRAEQQRKREEADVSVPVEAGDRVRVHGMAGVHDWMLESVGGFPIEGTVSGIDWDTEGCRNLMCDAVVRVRFTEEECPAVHNGTSEIYPLGRTRNSWDESNLEVV